MGQQASDGASVDQVWQTMSRRVLERGVAAIELLERLLHAHGRLVRREHELWAGDLVLNYDRELLPRAAKASGLGLSVYLGNRRIATFSPLDAGPTPEVGSYAEALLVDLVLRRRQPFRGTMECQGRPCLVAARPLYAMDKPEDYGPIGMLEAFQDERALRDSLAHSWGRLAEEPTATLPFVGLERHSERLEALMHFIDDVARRLQLLALNGNIIAAQAGQQGRAFRVVCRELGSLADQSKEAAAEVRRLTEELAADPSAPPPQG